MNFLDKWKIRQSLTKQAEEQIEIQSAATKAACAMDDEPRLVERHLRRIAKNASARYQFIDSVRDVFKQEK